MGIDLRATAGTRLIDHLEQLWNEIRAVHEEIPAAVIITGRGTSKRLRSKSVTYGHHRPACWMNYAGEHDPEIFVAGEAVAAGPEKVLQVMLHEGAHALGAVRGIKNCSGNRNQWHNKRFAELAREMGLEPPHRAEPTLGFSNCTLTQAALNHYGPVLGLIEKARLASLPGDGDGPADGDPNTPKPKKAPGEKTGGKRVLTVCGCEPARRLQLTPKQLAEGPVLCGVCGEAFVPREEPAAAPDDLEAPSADAAE